MTTTSMTAAGGPMLDARTFLDQHPELRDEKSAVLDLAYEEYCQRLDAGETPDPDAFCARFPVFKTSLRRLIAAHHFLEDNPHLLDDGQPVPFPNAGETFLGFTLLRELGRGAFARVYLAAEPELGNRLVAVKISPRGGKEAETLGRINHPNIVPVHAVRSESQSGLTAVCMPYLGTATLWDVLDGAFPGTGQPARARIILDAARKGTGPAIPGAAWLAPPPILERGTYVEGICALGAAMADALDYIHGLGICHRDLKPSNVLLCPDGRPMLLDFNLSADGGVAELVGGTLPYMAPEHIQATDLAPGRERPSLDARADIFSLGVLLYELLAGKHPFGPMNPGPVTPEVRDRLLARHHKGPQPLRRSNPDVGRRLARLVERCLACAPEDRPQSARAIATALRQELGLLRRLGRCLCRHPRLFAASAGLVLVTAAVGGTVWMKQPPPPDPLTAARQAFVAEDYARALSWWDRASPEQQSSSAAQFLRGQIAQRQMKWAQARDCYLAMEDGPSYACKGYCLSRLHEHAEAINAYTKAIELKYETPEVYNNLAYSQMQLGNLPEARRSLDRALDFEGTPRGAVYHNRLVLATDWWNRKNNRKWKQEQPPTPQEAIAALNNALRYGPRSGELYRDAVNLCAAFKEEIPAWKNQLLTYLEAAAKEGEELSIFRMDRRLDDLQGDQRFQDATTPRQPPRPGTLTTRLLDPSPPTP